MVVFNARNQLADWLLFFWVSRNFFENEKYRNFLKTFFASFIYGHYCLETASNQCWCSYFVSVWIHKIVLRTKIVRTLHENCSAQHLVNVRKSIHFHLRQKNIRIISISFCDVFTLTVYCLRLDVVNFGAPCSMKNLVHDFTSYSN